MNTELLRLSKTYINYDYLGTYVLGDASASEHTKLSFAFDGFENVITDFKCLSENEQAFLVGCFENKYTHKYAFCIIINDTKSSIADMQTLEDYLIRETYLRL